jgi:hypothetical protein
MERDGLAGGTVRLRRGRAAPGYTEHQGNQRDR